MLHVTDTSLAASELWHTFAGGAVAVLFRLGATPPAALAVLLKRKNSARAVPRQVRLYQQAAGS